MQQRNARIANRTGHLQIEVDQAQTFGRARRTGRGGKLATFQDRHLRGDPCHGKHQCLPEQRMVVRDQGRFYVAPAGCGLSATR
jgi:hypothetical protein